MYAPCPGERPGAALRPSKLSAGQRRRALNRSPRIFRYLAIDESSRLLRLASHQIQSSGYWTYPVPSAAYAQVGNHPPLFWQYISTPIPNCRILLRQTVRFATARALLSTGTRIAISTAIIPITTSNSTRVNPLLRLLIRIALRQFRCLMSWALKGSAPFAVKCGGSMPSEEDASQVGHPAVICADVIHLADMITAALSPARAGPRREQRYARPAPRGRKFRFAARFAPG